MELFRKAGLMVADPDSVANDWVWEHGLAQTSEFPFPDLYLHPSLTSVAAGDPDLAPFLEDCLVKFVHHDYGNIISMDQLENFLSRDLRKEYTWMQGIYASEKWGWVHLEVFYDMGIFHLEDAPPRDLALAQRAKEREEK
ncbi:MAG: hypothetical protein IJO69_10240 [Ruminiclostridium sp.]|nr:hypothetical protein [Ruminiclostridium sp.]